MSKFDRSLFRGTKRIVIHKQLISRRFSEIKEYIEETRSLIQKKQNEIKEYVGRELEGIEDNDLALGIVEFHSEDFNKYENTYTEFDKSCQYLCTYLLNNSVG
jgi:hypothetical protein